MWLYSVARPTSQCLVISSVRYSVEIPHAIPYDPRTHWCYIHMKVVAYRPVRQPISRNDNPLLIGNNPASNEFRHLQVSIFYYSRHNTIFSANSDLTKSFPNTQLFFYAALQISFLPPASSKCAIVLIVCTSEQPFLPFMWFWGSHERNLCIESNITHN